MSPLLVGGLVISHADELGMQQRSWIAPQMVMMR
jgi:PEP-CTERM motif